jgi:hypothetical protein
VTSRKLVTRYVYPGEPFRLTWTTKAAHPHTGIPSSLALQLCRAIMRGSSSVIREAPCFGNPSRKHCLGWHP